MILTVSDHPDELWRPRPAPSWTRGRTDIKDDSDVAFLAGAALASLDNVLRAQPDWAGAWTQRLALRAAAASCRHLGRTEDESTLRDLWLLRAPGADPGPPGRVLMAWHALLRADRLQPAVLQTAAAQLGLSDDVSAEELARCLEKSGGGPITRACAAAAAVMAAGRQDAPTELLALWIADAVLARELRWPHAVSLLAGEMLPGRGGGRRLRPGDPAWGHAATAAYAAAAVRAVDIACELARRSDTLRTVAPKLRTKNAGAAIETLLREDAITPARVRGRLSDRAARRLFERLVTLGGVRELSGRPTFRVYGL